MVSSKVLIIFALFHFLVASLAEICPGCDEDIDDVPEDTARWQQDEVVSLMQTFINIKQAPRVSGSDEAAPPHVGCSTPDCEDEGDVAAMYQTSVVIMAAPRSEEAEDDVVSF
eukprot:CAMPEP_0170612602 /NCGR_PEP_ID=MMETSP0224-20130122/23811_1 /TAXON_ID=285029 /ORGANISM="Togula jolla, Strain CCCM 725" /LENGTH=112 /DNA_ID=CAMNT_0010938117 /DNA_START=63 /DNA_END=401 /DNA_ORIENTATION=+